MKNIISVFALLIALTLPAVAAFDTYALAYQDCILPATSVTNASAFTTVTGDAFDLLQYKGFATITVSHGAELGGATNRVSILSLQQTNTLSGGWSVYCAVTNSTASPTFTRIPFEIGKGGRFIRGVYTSTNANSAVSASINALK